VSGLGALSSCPNRGQAPGAIISPRQMMLRWVLASCCWQAYQASTMYHG